MQILKFDSRNGEMKIIPETMEDLWHLSRVLEQSDIIASKSSRAYKKPADWELEGEIEERKHVYIEIIAEKIEFHKYSNRLRATGKIIAGNPEEFVQLSKYHTIDIELGEPVTVKKGWKSYQIDMLKHAQKSSKKPKIGIAVMDDESALFSTIKDYGVEFELELSSHTSKKDEKFEEKKNQFLGDIFKKLKEMKVDKIIIGGPGFTKDNLKKFISDRDKEFLKKLVFESCSTAERSGVYELLKRGVLSKIAIEERVEMEFSLMEKLLVDLSKGTGLALYGIEQVKKAVEYKAVKELFIVDESLRKNKDVEKILEEAEKIKADITIFSSENEAGKQLAGFGGIACTLRFKIYT